MERIPFDIKYRHDIEAGKYLIDTRVGYSVRIVYWEAKSGGPLVCLVTDDDGREELWLYPISGRYDGETTISGADLFLVPNPDYKEPTAEPSVDWDAFRREASLQIAAGFAVNGNFLERSIGHISEDIADCAVVTADMLIKRLKEEKK